MKVLNQQEEDFISSHKPRDKKNEIFFWIAISIIAVAQVAFDMLTAFTKYKFTDLQALALKNSGFWIFILIFLAVIKNRQKNYILIIRKLIKATENIP